VNTRNLETLLWVIRLGGVGAAARHLNLTQPGVTRRVQELERELGSPLFMREGRAVIPTPLAESCAANAERILAEVSLMQVAARGQGVVEGRVRVGLAEAIALALLARLMARVADAYPNVVLDCDVDLSSRLLGKLARRQLDIVLVPGPVSIPGALRTPLGTCTLLWMASPLLLRGRRKATLEIVDLPVISLPHDADVHWTMMKWFEEAGAQPRRITYCNNFGVVVSLVRKGVGASLLPYELFKREVDAGSLVVLPEGGPAIKPEYSTVYLPSAELHILPRIAQFAREEGLFAGS
jgi:DNA-binding transcriptional LysR family regulator